MSSRGGASRSAAGHVDPATVRRMPTPASGSRPERFLRATSSPVIRDARNQQRRCMPSVTRDRKTPSRAGSGRVSAEARLPGMRLRPLERCARDAFRKHGRSHQDRAFSIHEVLLFSISWFRVAGSLITRPSSGAASLIELLFSLSKRPSWRNWLRRSKSSYGNGIAPVGPRSHPNHLLSSS
jgi:hypothetical protein